MICVEMYGTNRDNGHNMARVWKIGENSMQVWFLEAQQYFAVLDFCEIKLRL